MIVSRRTVAVGLSTLPLIAAADASRAVADSFAGLERKNGGRLGVFALDTGSGRSLGHRADERFLMCSTFKLLAVGDVLSRVDAGRERLDRRIAYGEKDLLEYAPITRAHVKDGALSVEALCAAAIEKSDNTAANLLLALLGGPQDITRFARRLGDKVTRLDRNEPTLNRPDGEKDTTSPQAMARSARKVLLGETLGAASRARLEGWMTAGDVGLGRVRAGVPADWRAGDKPGTGKTQTNDVAILRPPGRAPIIVAAYYAGSEGGGATANAVLKQVGALVVAWASREGRR